MAAGISSSAPPSPGISCCRKNIPTFAINSRWTHGVTGVPPSLYRRALEGLECSRLLLPGGERLVQPRPEQIELSAELVRPFYTARLRIELRVVQRRRQRGDLSIDLRHFPLGFGRTVAR